MKINMIDPTDLRRMNDKEGLILQGCGGDLVEWVNGINEMFTEEKILLNGTRFENVSFFQLDGVNCLLYPFDGVELDIGRLAMWRLRSHEALGGTWLSDFVPNRLGGFVAEALAEAEKPDCPLIGKDGNVFNLIGIAARTLRENGQPEKAKEMSQRVFTCSSYEEALTTIGEYVHITSDAEMKRAAPRKRLSRDDRGR